MAIELDFSIDYDNKIITHASGLEVYSVNELYSYLQDTFDELIQLDDDVPMSAQTPTEYTFINGWFMDDTSYQYLASGSIQTSGYSGSVYVIRLNSGGYTNAIPAAIGAQVTGGDSSHVGTLLAYDNTNRKWWVRASSSNDVFSQSEAIGVSPNSSGSGTNSALTVTGEDLFPNLYTLGSIVNTNSIYIVQTGSVISSWWDTGHIDVLIKVKEAGTEIDEGNLTVFARDYTDTYDYFDIDVSTGGRNAIPLATQDDLNNTTSGSKVAVSQSDVIIGFVNGQMYYDNEASPFTSSENNPTPSIAAYVTGSTTGTTAFLLRNTDSGSYGTLILANVSGSGFQDNEPLSQSISGRGLVSGTLNTAVQVIYKDLNNGNSYNPYSVVVSCAGELLADVYEYTKYVTRSGSTFLTWAGNAALEGQQYKLASGSFTPVKAAPFGTFAGGKFFAAQGVWLENYNTTDAQNFQLIDSNGVTQVPPNTVSVTVTSVQSGDRVAVFVLETAGGEIDKDKYTSAAGNISGNGTLVVTQSLASDTPQAGVVRILNDRYSYSSYNGSVFTLTGTLSTTYDTGSAVYVPIIDQEATSTSVSNTLIYSSNIPVLVRVRKKGILPFEVESTVTSVGMSVSAIRTTDTIVT